MRVRGPGPVEELAGRLCGLLLPIREGRISGSPGSTVAVCTLSSMGLLRRLAGPSCLAHIHTAGRLLSENRGIDSVVEYLAANARVRTLVVCGREVPGHRAGRSLLMLHRNGTDREGMIIGSDSPYPALRASGVAVAHFRRNVTVEDMVGTDDPGEVLSRVISLQ